MLRAGASFAQMALERIGSTGSAPDEPACLTSTPDEGGGRARRRKLSPQARDHTGRGSSRASATVTDAAIARQAQRHPQVIWRLLRRHHVRPFAGPPFTGIGGGARQGSDQGEVNARRRRVALLWLGPRHQGDTRALRSRRCRRADAKPSGPIRTTRLPLRQARALSPARRLRRARAGGPWHLRLAMENKLDSANRWFESIRRTEIGRVPRRWATTNRATEGIPKEEAASPEPLAQGESHRAIALAEAGHPWRGGSPSRTSASHRCQAHAAGA